MGVTRVSKQVSQSRMLDTIEAYGIDRKLLEQTDPSEELILKLYAVITAIHEKELELRQGS